MIKTPTLFADVLYEVEPYGEFVKNLHILDKQFDAFLYSFSKKRKTKDKDVDLKCCLLIVDFLLICVLNFSLHQMLSYKLPYIDTNPF